MDIISAYREVGSYRGAAELCGTTHKTVKRIVEQFEAGDTPTRLLQTHLTSAHRCPPRIASTHLRSTLVHRTADEIAFLHTDLGKLCDSAESSLLHHAAASARDRRSTLVAVAAAGALFATSLHAAGAASLENLQRWGLTVAVVTAIGAVALLEGVARRRPSGTLTIPRPVSPPLASPAVKPVKDLERRRRESIFPFETDLWRTAPSRREMTPTLRECLEANNLSDFGPSISPPVMASRSSRPVQNQNQNRPDLQDTCTGHDGDREVPARHSRQDQCAGGQN